MMRCTKCGTANPHTLVREKQLCFDCILNKSKKEVEAR